MPQLPRNVAACRLRLAAIGGLIVFAPTSFDAGKPSASSALAATRVRELEVALISCVVVPVLAPGCGFAASPGTRSDLVRRRPGTGSRVADSRYLQTLPVDRTALALTLLFSAVGSSGAAMSRDFTNESRAL